MNENSDIHIQGEHSVKLSRQTLWEALNDPKVLQRCIKGCNRVRRLSDDEFCADFKVRIGPIRKKFQAALKVVHVDPPAQYRLESNIDAGIAGEVIGVAHVNLAVLNEENTNLQYEADVDVVGWLGDLGIKVLGGAAERYMEKFFDRMISVIEDRGTDS